MNAAPKILAISGSLSADSRTCKITEQVLDLAKSKGAQVELIDLRKHVLPLYDDRENDSTYPATVQSLKEKIKSSDVIILSTPVYHGVMSGALKNALDFVSMDQCRKKIFGAISVSGGMAGINAINGLLFTIQALEGISGPTTLAVPNSAIGQDGRLEDVRTLKRASVMVDELLDFAKKFSSK